MTQLLTLFSLLTVNFSFAGTITLDTTEKKVSNFTLSQVCSKEYDWAEVPSGSSDEWME